MDTTKRLEEMERQASLQRGGGEERKEREDGARRGEGEEKGGTDKGRKGILVCRAYLYQQPED